MDCVLQTPECAVFDNVLNAEQFEALWKHVQLVDYRSVHSEKWEKVWRMHDGEVFWGPKTTWHTSENSVPKSPEGNPDKSSDPVCYPTGTATDALMERILAKAVEHPHLVGTQASDWESITTQPYLYPVGSGLSGHTDSVKYTGAYTYYCHPEWNCVYGGELMVSPADSSKLEALLPHVIVYEVEGNEITKMEKRYVGSHLDNRAENKVLSQSGIGTYIAPKPNRLILLKGGTYHQVKPVAPAAGRLSRASVAGFFLAKDYAPDQ